MWCEYVDGPVWRSPWWDARQEVIMELRVLEWDNITTSFASGVVGPRFYRQAMESHAECLREGRPSFVGGSSGVFPPMALGLSLQMMG